MTCLFKSNARREVIEGDPIDTSHLESSGGSSSGASGGTSGGSSSSTTFFVRGGGRGSGITTFLGLLSGVCGRVEEVSRTICLHQDEENALTGAGSALALVDLMYHMVMIRRQR